LKITIEIPNERGGECENTSGEIENFDSFELFKLKKLTEFLYEFPSVDAINEDGDLVQLICNDVDCH